MFEERTIPLYTYNIETLLAEKLETLMARGTANTRMRDFYDIHVILEKEVASIDFGNLKKAFLATSENRATSLMIPELFGIIDDVRMSPSMEADWNNYKSNNYFVGELAWEAVVNSAQYLVESICEDETAPKDKVSASKE